MAKQRVVDFIADYLSQIGIDTVFGVVGGGAMYLNNGFAKNENIKCIYNHHEQASAIAAEAYFKQSGKMAVVCVTSGPGGTNTLTGVLCAYLDNIPMLVISGQVRYATTVESTNLKLRQFGEQEYGIVDSAKPMTKYAIMIKDPLSIKYHLEKAVSIALSGRKGPCWLDIPLDVQSAVVDTKKLESYEHNELNCNQIQYYTEQITNELKKAKRPVILAGSAIRTSGSINTFYKLVNQLKIPVICPTSVSDYFHNGHLYYFGNFGVFGGRAGNFIVQNSDLILSLGCRLSFKQTGFNYTHFAPNSKKIVVDVDENELKKQTIHIDIPIECDVKEIISSLTKTDNINIYKEDWYNYCYSLKKAFPNVLDKHRIMDNKVNPYYMAEVLNTSADAESVMVVGNSCSSVSFLQTGIHKEGQRLFGNTNCGTMGYDLPAAIGAAVSSKNQVFCITGDGSIQMNIQELQTIVHNNLSVKIIIFNNLGYQAIVQTQNNFFNGFLAGCTAESGVSFPSFEKLAFAYGIPFKKIEKNKDVREGINWLLKCGEYCILEVTQDTTQPIEPKVQSKRTETGELFSPPLDDLSPFLSEEDYKKYQFDNFGGVHNERL